jgi:scyllo-inositol 2-dehydrogenase (NADP+)
METRIINTALCSYGMSGKLFHAPFIDATAGFNLYAVWERSKNTAAADHPNIQTYHSLEALLADGQVELVVVNTPNSTHYGYAKQCLDAGKHVIVEKPFTVTTAEATELMELAQAKGLLLSVYQNRRYDSDFRTIQQVLQQALLGDVVEAEFHFDRYREALSPKLHKETPGPGTGALYDLGAHLIDQALLLFGMPQAVFADIAIIRPQSQVDDYFELLLYYPKLRVRLKCSYLVKEALPGYIIHGSKGSFIKPKTDVQETQLQAGNKPTDNGWGQEPPGDRGLLHTAVGGKTIREHIPSLQGHYGDYYKAVYGALVHNGPVPVTAAEGKRVIQIIEAAIESNRTQKVVAI